MSDRRFDPDFDHYCKTLNKTPEIVSMEDVLRFAFRKSDNILKDLETHTCQRTVVGVYIAALVFTRLAHLWDSLDNAKSSDEILEHCQKLVKDAVSLMSEADRTVKFDA